MTAEQDRVPLDRASAEHLKRGDLLDVVLDTGEEQRLVVVDDPKANADGSVTFGVASPERVAAMEWFAALTQWPDQPTSTDIAVEQLEVHHAAARTSTREEREAAHVAHLRRERTRVAATRAQRYATGGVVRTAPAVVGDGPKGATL